MRQTTGKLIMVFCLVVTMAGLGRAYTWQDVTQQAGPVVAKPEAYLKVYSEARVVMDGDITRTSRVPYTIYSEDGKKLKFVAFNDEDPKLVTLSPGKYVIVPETNLTKTQVYGAILKRHQLTEVHMTGEQPTYAPANF